MRSCWLITATLMMISSFSHSAEADHVITLGAALKIAGAEDVEVKLASERSLEARARYQQAQQKFLPWLTPGLAYRRLDGRTQDVIGDIVTVDKQSFGVGLTLTAEIALGEAIYESLITKRRLHAAEHETNVIREQTLFDTRRLYFNLVETQAKLHLADNAVQQASEYADEIQHAQSAGLVSAGDVARAKAKVQRCQIHQKKSQMEISVASARLAEVLRLQEGVSLRADDAELQPMVFVDAKAELAALLTKALTQREEFQVMSSLRQAAVAQQDQTEEGALIPRIILRGSTGGLGGGRDDSWGNFGATSELAVGVEWRIGPGGLFDSARQDIAGSQLRQLMLQEQRLRDRITREVQESYAVARSASDQIALTLSLVNTTEQSLQLARNRRDSGIAAVMEAITADEDLISARNEYIEAVSHFNQGQSALLHAVGTKP